MSVERDSSQKSIYIWLPGRHARIFLHRSSVLWRSPPLQCQGHNLVVHVLRVEEWNQLAGAILCCAIQSVIVDYKCFYDDTTKFSSHKIIFEILSFLVLLNLKNRCKMNQRISNGFCLFNVKRPTCRYS